MILNKETSPDAKDFLKQVVDMCVDFKLQEKIHEKHFRDEQCDGREWFESLPNDGKDIEAVLREFSSNFLCYCTNFSSANFMGFPDSGNSVAAMGGAIFGELLQQNLINQSFCGPSATFAEICVIQWIREIVGYKTNDVKNVWDAGGIITPGGTSSNSIAMMLARENKAKGTMEKGVFDPQRFKIIMPKGIGHYSIRSSQMWIGCGDNTIEVSTDNYRMNIPELESALEKHKGNIMAIVVYAGDSRSMTIDNLEEIYETVKKHDSDIWLHVDACHGFSLGFSDNLKYKIKGIEHYDSISTDPHKVLCTPYVVSALLVKEPNKLKMITSKSDLIMQEDFAFGQITPFLGSRNWSSLKLWFLIKNLGKKGLGEIVEKRHYLATYLKERLEIDGSFVVLNDVGINSVMFMYKSYGHSSIDAMNSFNRKVHKAIVEEGKYHLHQFSVLDDKGVIKKGEVLYPLRYMCGNPNTTEKDINNMIEYVKLIAKKLGGF